MWPTVFKSKYYWVGSNIVYTWFLLGKLFSPSQWNQHITLSTDFSNKHLLHCSQCACGSQSHSSDTKSNLQLYTDEIRKKTVSQTSSLLEWRPLLHGGRSTWFKPTWIPLEWFYWVTHKFLYKEKRNYYGREPCLTDLYMHSGVISWVTRHWYSIRATVPPLDPGLEAVTKKTDGLQ